MLQPGARGQFEREGFIVIDTTLDQRLLDRARRDVGGLFGDPPLVEHGVHRFGDRVMDAWRVSEAVRSIALAEDMLAALGELVAPRPRPFQTLNFAVGTEQDVHSDAFHFNSSPPGLMCGVWVALEDVDETNGPLVYYPGSHRLPEVSLDDLDRRVGEEIEDSYQRHVPTAIERAGLKPRLATLRRGQALVWAGNLLHGGSPRRDPGRSRYSQVTHYLFGDAGCWVPKRSTAERIRRREPYWIT
jgi:hypothetical protein